MTTTRRLGLLLLSVALVLGAVVACSSNNGANGPETTSTTAAPAPTTPATCDDAKASYAPAGAQASDAKLAQIRARRKLIVGVSADTYGFGFRNPFTGQLEGFDIDMAHAVAQAIFGDPNAIEYKVVALGQREGVLLDNSVDMVADVFTMTCDRWTRIAFSSQYFAAEKKILVAKESGITGIDDLAGRKVCVSQGSTTAARVAEHPDVVAVPVPQNSDCMVLFQSGEVDAVAGDVPILTGFAKQDPYAVIVGPSLSDEPYGLGVNAANVDLVRFVNSVLADMRANGEWTRIYNTWLAPPAPAPPPAVYGRG
jgi:polar amino acid transport system substrate-binding protein